MPSSIFNNSNARVRVSRASRQGESGISTNAGAVWTMTWWWSQSQKVWNKIIWYHGEYGYSRKGQLALHITQVLWSVVEIGVVITSMSAKGRASNAIKYM